MKEPILYKIVRPILTFLFKLVYRPKIIGAENIPKNKKIILAGNHTNNLDCILLISSTKRVIHFLAKDSLNKGIKKIIFKNMGIIPVNRKIHDKNVVKKSCEYLNNNKVIGIFPEGTINRSDDIILPFKYGAVSMASKTDSSIVPFCITGNYKPFKNNLKIVFSPSYKLNSDDLTIENKILEDKIIQLINKER